MSHLPIPTSEQIRAAWHIVWTDELNLHRRCASLSELDRVADRKQALIGVEEQIRRALDCFRNARTLRSLSDAPGHDLDALRAEANAEDARAYLILREVYAVLNLPTQ